MKLSVLELAMMWNGATAGEAFQEAVDLAKHVEGLGYTRYWFAEHHNTAYQASSAPELLVAHIAASTSKLRVGSGGVMLPNHSSLKVAENFRTLEALYPQRVDLGLGRAPGTDGTTALALRRSNSPQALHADDFPEQLTDLLGFLSGDFPEDHAYRRMTTTPVVSTTPELWMLGSSDGGAKLAAKHGLGLAFAHHINPEMAAPMLKAYRHHFEPSAFMDKPRSIFAASVICAATDAEAEELAAPMLLQWTRWGQGQGQEQHKALPTIEEALAYRYTPEEEKIRRGSLTRHIIGSVERVTNELRTLAEEASADELMILTMTPDREARFRSYELLAEAFLK
ncbi:LLM class flavin-dependent oxidoreductase [Paenibacillus eucommiae]|uniref:Luciferase family oxidoreductase group 1 n=1 Tax=Paenibacillus eucommiae TaxID=1355755 RepID=A0ABS4J4T6_9BACL|nr:LLM class flavin-dependent oxidoreductase [Paenibacillus eucommiae]MBP1994830.1 luciferase family oxidoreductase group 1 [Paenibacillus eucommiae]